MTVGCLTLSDPRGRVRAAYKTVGSDLCFYLGQTIEESGVGVALSQTFRKIFLIVILTGDARLEFLRQKMRERIECAHAFRLST